MPAPKPIWPVSRTNGSGSDSSGAPGINGLSDLFQPGVNIAGLFDFRRFNFGGQKISGLDFNAAYTKDVGFGTVFGSVGGTYIMHNGVSTTPTSPYVNQLKA